MGISKVLANAFLHNLPVSGLTFNSADVRPGTVFFALQGANADGNRFIADAVSKGAVMVVSAKAAEKDWGVLYYRSDDIDRDMADAAYEFYNRPSDRLKIIGITGTKGKTSIAYLVESVLAHAGKNVGALGTVSYRINGKKVMSAPNTTPAALTLFNLLHRMENKQTEFVVMEVSSHALELQRVRHINFDTAVFTNLQRDHLDFHKTFENYFMAKRKLFENLLDPNNPKPHKTAVINLDDPYGQTLAELLKGKVRVVTYSLENFDADYKADSVRESLDKTEFVLNGLPAQINLLGKHNVYNALAAYAVCLENGVDEQTALEGLALLPGVPGRMERIDEGQDFYVFVDFAYTDESLQRAYKTVQNFKKGRVITVFGCGGQRDTTKRPLMGRTACTNSDLVFLTNDNPRCEDPERIFKDITAGMNGFSNYKIVPDRAQAIAKALSAAQKDDIVIIAGKGHEDYQIVGTEKRPFSDQETVRRILRGKTRV